MVLEVVKERYKNKTGGSEFKRFHWWEAVRHQSKWRAKSAISSITNSWVSSSDRMGEEEVTHPIGRDRAKAV
jgi:ribosomal protein L32E